MAEVIKRYIGNDKVWEEGEINIGAMKQPALNIFNAEVIKKPELIVNEATEKDDTRIFFDERRRTLSAGYVNRNKWSFRFKFPTIKDIVAGDYYFVKMNQDLGRIVTNFSFTNISFRQSLNDGSVNGYYLRTYDAGVASGSISTMSSPPIGDIKQIDIWYEKDYPIILNLTEANRLDIDIEALNEYIKETGSQVAYDLADVPDYEVLYETKIIKVGYDNKYLEIADEMYAGNMEEVLLVRIGDELITSKYVISTEIKKWYGSQISIPLPSGFDDRFGAMKNKTLKFYGRKEKS